MDYLDPMVTETARGKTLVDLLFIAYQEESRDAGIELEGAFGPLHHDTTPVVATHDIHCYSHNGGLDAARSDPAGSRNQAPAVTDRTWRPL